MPRKKNSSVIRLLRSKVYMCSLCDEEFGSEMAVMVHKQKGRHAQRPDKARRLIDENAAAVATPQPSGTSQGQGTPSPDDGSPVSPAADYQAMNSGTKRAATDENDQRRGDSTSAATKKQRVQGGPASQSPLGPRGASIAANGVSVKQELGTSASDVRGAESVRISPGELREKTRADELEKRIESVLGQIQKLQDELDNRRAAHPADGNDDDGEAEDGEEHENGVTTNSNRVGNKKRTRLSPGEEEVNVNSRLRYFFYMEHAYIPSDIRAKIFDGERGEGLQAVIFDRLAEIFGGASKLKERSSARLFAHARGRAYAEATKRISDCLATITGLDNKTLRNKKSDKIKALLGDNGMQFMWRAPGAVPSGFCLSKVVIDTMSALIHGPGSVGCTSAEKRSTVRASTRFSGWIDDEKTPMDSISPNFVAFSSAILFHHLRGFTQFKFDDNPTSKFHPTFRFFAEVSGWFERKPDVGAGVISRINRELIPKRKEVVDVAPEYDFAKGLSFDENEVDVLGDGDEIKHEESESDGDADGSGGEGK